MLELDEGSISSNDLNKYYGEFGQNQQFQC